MVTLRFIVLNGVLVLRIAEGRVRYYKSVTYLLKGRPNLKKHWVKEKERFSAYAVFYAENNKTLDEFKAIYWRLITERPELTARQVADFYKHRPPVSASAIVKERIAEWPVEQYKNSVRKFLETVILRERAKQGCNFEAYAKLLARCRTDIPGFDTMEFSTIDYNRMVDIAYIFARRLSYRSISKTFRALLGKAHKDRNVMFNLSQIGTFCFGDYNPDKNNVIEHHPDVLSNEQLRQFMNLDLRRITPTYKDRKQVELYYDFCVFMLHTFFAPCDVLKARHKDMTRRNTLMVKRKKTHRTVEVPITPTVRAIINKYRGKSKDGYIFPIMDDEVDRTHPIKDYILKKFREHLNLWLKALGKELNTEYRLYAYVFRHTAITVAINNGLPISYVAKAAGTSVEMIQKHYYNGECAQNREMLTSAFMNAGV